MSEDITPGATSLEGGTAPADNPAADTPTPADSPAPEGGAPTSQPTDWRTGFPEAWGEKLKDVESADDALKALERGLSYTPALKPEDVELKYPDGMQVDEGVRDNFRQFCVDKGITPAQAQALLDWQLAANREIADAVMARGKAELQKLVVNLDRRMGGKLSEALAFSGMNNNPVLVEAFHHIGTLISADALSGGKAAPAQDKAETAEETYNGMFK